MIQQLFFALCLILFPGSGFAACVDLSGSFNECQLIGATPEKFRFEVKQKFSRAELVYSARAVRDGKSVEVPFITDALARPLRDVQGAPLVEIPLEYSATCDSKNLFVTVTAMALPNAAAEKFQISKDEAGNLRVSNQSFVLGQPVSANREVVCEK